VAHSEQTTTDEPGRTRRATAMPPDERRAAIAAATVPLLLEHGLAVTTRQIAEAAGIAEGTIFRAFPDKEAVVDAAVEMAFDPSSSEREIEAIDAHLPFEHQLEEAVAIIQRRVSLVWRLLSLVGERRKLPERRPPDSPGMVALFARHDDRVRVNPARAAQQMRALTLALCHPTLTDEEMTPAEIVSVLLDGIRDRSEALDGAVDLAAAVHATRP
jgi:AcrR family transcriptional regulator